ncbi:LADA_0H04786g1_1 [Lachancea dasiensis]|uniref:LADA_0H04786g1_1 n=1 Tax=Lachancea dasiensis TaxID=1072105 RepID=A0A1G4K0X5_9SACH|nr:LADA_0H04786g1_1 [Lachancea dasiensis]
MMTAPCLKKERIAILFQALEPPVIDGQRKKPKPGGYSDSGADIGFTLQRAGREVLTPVPRPDPTCALDWVFPDTVEGIEVAIRQGATIIWANTVLFVGHPLVQVMDRVKIIGQLPVNAQRFDDKFKTNRMLSKEGIFAARSFSIGYGAESEISLENLNQAVLAVCGLAFPMILKPIRGRGSQGVVRVESLSELKIEAEALLSSGHFGSSLIVEEYLSGEELTVTVMPPKSRYRQGNQEPLDAAAFWGLRPVCRVNHVGGVAPYNGTVAVSQNSLAVSGEKLAQPLVRSMLKACLKTAALVEARAPIRIDCRADHQGIYRLFDLNMKPNMTGPGRPGRDDQNSLSAIAAQADGLSYLDLLTAMLAAAWTDDHQKSTIKHAPDLRQRDDLSISIPNHL